MANSESFIRCENIQGGATRLFSFKNLILAFRKQNNDDRRIYTEAAQYF